MMSGMPLETCWAFNKLWNNKFYYKAASCWYFYWVNSSFSRVQATTTAHVIWGREQILLPKCCFILGYQTMYNPETEQSYHMPPYHRHLKRLRSNDTAMDTNRFMNYAFWMLSLIASADKGQHERNCKHGRFFFYYRYDWKKKTR